MVWHLADVNDLRKKLLKTFPPKRLKLLGKVDDAGADNASGIKKRAKNDERKIESNFLISK